MNNFKQAYIIHVDFFIIWKWILRAFNERRYLHTAAKSSDGDSRQR